MKIRNIICSFVILFTLTGCFEDKSNYNYNMLPKGLNVRFVPGTSRNTVQGEPLTLVAEMYNIPDGYESEYTYEWINDKREVIGTGNEYTIEAKEVGKFYYGVIATDVKSGAAYSTSNYFTVAPIFERGFVILSEDGENSDMHFVVSSLLYGDKETFRNDSIIFTKEFTSIYKTMVNEPLIGKPLRITEHWGHEVYGVMGELSVETKVGNEHKIIEVNGSTMKRETYVEQEFIDGIVPTNFKPKKIIQAPWDSYIINEDGRVFARRSASNKGFHLGYYDAKTPLWGTKANIENIFMAHYPDCNLLLAIEKDPVTGKRNYAAVFEQGYSVGNSSLRVPQQFNDNPKYNDLKDEVIFDDYFKTKNKYGMNALIMRNSSNQLILNILTYEARRFDGVRYLYFIEPEIDSNSEDQPHNTINLTQKYGINSLKGMFTIKTYYDKIVYMYDDHNLYCYDYLNDTFKTVHTFSNKVIAAATSHSMITRDENRFESFEIRRVSLAFGFDDGSFEVYELNVDMAEKADDFDKLGKLIYQNKGNFGKIKQILYKIGEDTAGFTSTY